MDRQTAETKHCDKGNAQHAIPRRSGNGHKPDLID
jgi:hypothetical protein